MKHACTSPVNIIKYICTCHLATFFFVFVLHAGAVQRKYESIRRQWVIDGKENSADMIEAQAKMNKYRARRVRVS